MSAFTISKEIECFLLCFVSYRVFTSYNRNKKRLVTNVDPSSHHSTLLTRSKRMTRRPSSTQRVQVSEDRHYRHRRGRMLTNVNDALNDDCNNWIERGKQGSEEQECVQSAWMERFARGEEPLFPLNHEFLRST